MHAHIVNKSYTNMFVYPRIFLVKNDLEVTVDDVCNIILFKIIILYIKRETKGIHTC